MITLSGQYRRDAAAALVESFTSESLERLLSSMGTPLHEIASPTQSYASQVLQVVDALNRQGRIADFLRIAREANPSSLSLRTLSESVGLVPATETESLIDAIRPMIAPGQEGEWRRGLEEVSRQVCLIETASGASGTGFLIGPDQVMTHKAVLANNNGGLIAHFDVTPTSRRSYRILPEVVFESATGAIVQRLDVAAGRDISTSSDAVTQSRARGWISLTGLPSSGRAVVVVQHAGARELQIGVDADGLIGEQDGKIRYRTSTLYGSMGGPCFDAAWRLIGIHIGSHLGDGGTTESNEGIAIAAVLADLRAQQCVWDPTSGIVRTAGAAAASHEVRGDLDDFLRGYAIDESPSPDDVWSDDIDDDPSDPTRWAWAEAAAVTATYRPQDLVIEGAPSVEALSRVLMESAPVQAANGAARWALPDRIRGRALQRLAERGVLQAVRMRNQGDPGDPVNAALGAFIAGAAPTRAERQDPVHLRALLRAAGWLSQTGLALPSVLQLRADLERARLIAPFKHLTRGFFAGRDKELAMLAAYVEGPDTDASGVSPPPIMLHAPGGMGKSALLAYFILAHSERDATRPDAWRPFVYLDFDRPELDARDLRGVLLAIVQQIGIQVPGIEAAATELLESWTARRRADHQQAASPRRRRRTSKTVKLAPRSDLDDLVKQVANLLNEARHGSTGPIVLILDTLEEVQYATPDAVLPLADLVVRLRARVPSLRPLLAGRVELGPEAELDEVALGPLPQSAAEALLSNHLPPVLAAKTDLVARMIQVVGGNPLSLRLAADMLRLETGASDLGETELWQRVGDAIVQGQLYERIAGHLHEGPVKQMAIPGLVLRYFTPELIEKVLAGPCELRIKDASEARALFDDLAREVAVVRQGDSLDMLALRPDLRRTVLDGFRQDAASAAKRQLIHEAAVAYFASRPGPENRAEEIYHRLWLDQDPDVIDARWLTGIELRLRSAVEELGGRARVHLANRVGGVDDAGALTASQEEWERYAENRAADLLQLGLPEKALVVLGQRSERQAASRLHIYESSARTVLGQYALAEAAAVEAASAARVSADPEEIATALEQLITVRRLIGDTEGVLRALAELSDLGTLLGDDLILVEAATVGLEAIAMPDTEQHSFSGTAVRVFSRLPDEMIVRAPELARRVVAQVGGDYPEVLQRVVRLVGIGPLDPAAADSLNGVLADWARRLPEIEAAVPRTGASVTEIGSAAQSLLSGRTPDYLTAANLATWMRSYVTPHTDGSGVIRPTQR